MARQILPILFVFMLFAGAGCQSPRVVEDLPAPNFNGPVVAQQPAPPPANRAAPPAIRTSPAIPKDWVPYATARPWRWIIIHHSATTSGSAKSFDRMHRDKGWDELGYHFVIGNGTESGNGQIQVGPRWGKQKWGAHAKTPDNRFNDYGIGICLVGNFDVQRPTPQQLQSLNRLVAYLMKTYRIPPQNVLGHGETKPTDCPGRNFNVASIRRSLLQTAELTDTEDSQPQPAKFESEPEPPPGE
ncbi:MAG: peptidoglycan recognition protein family protein [Tepidisphaeraceae bacterium]